MNLRNGILMLLIVGLCSNAQGADDRAAAGSDAQSVSGYGNRFDLTIVYSPVHEDGPAQLDLFLASWESNAPIAGAEIELTMAGADTRRILAVSPTEEAGRYAATIDAVSDGEYSFLAEIRHEDSSDLLSITEFHWGGEVHQDEQPAATIDWLRYAPYILAAVAVVAGLLGFSFGASSTRSSRAEIDPTTEEIVE